MKLFLVILMIFLLESSFIIQAADIFSGPSATGNGLGGDLNNRFNFTGFTGGTRGNRYILIEGNYGSITLGTAASSTTTITVEYLTSASSGVAGYASSLHDGQAVFGTITANDPYYIVDGKTRTESTAWGEPAGYGFRATDITANSLNGDNADNSIFRYIDFGGTWEINPSAGTIATYGNPVYLVYNQNNITFTRCAFHNGMGIQAAGANNLTFEYCHFGQMWGKQALRGGNGSTSSGWLIWFNRFKDSSIKDPNDGSSGTTGEICLWDSASGSFDNNIIVGNWFSHTRSTGRNTSIVIGGDGGSWAGVGGTGNLVYNNTWANINEAATFPMVDLNGTGNIARNNLFYGSVDSDVSANTTSDNDVAGADPFVNYGTLDLRLSGATSPGTTLSAPYDTDPLGATRGDDGTWDVGAYEYDSGGGGTSGGGSGDQRVTITGNVTFNGNITK
jgi:hypothetical protein